MKMLATDTRRLRFAALAMRITNVALLAVALYLLIGIVRQVGGGDEARSTAPVSARPLAPEVDVETMVNRLPFAAEKDPDDEPEETKTRTKGRPASDDYELLGTVAGDDRTARAIILDKKTKSQSVYKIGDVVTGARIDQIERLRVSLTRNGRREYLENERELSLWADRL